MAAPDQADPSLAALAIGGPAAPWSDLGLEVTAGASRVGDVLLTFGGDGSGIAGWALRDCDAPAIDGLPVIEEPAPREGGDHPLGAVRIDHVVVATPDVDRTIAAFEQAGIRLRREREGGGEGRPLRQAFFRAGEVIIEVVGPPGGPAGEGPAAFWGLVLVVEDLEAAAEHLGERLGRVKDAVQPGRRIATVRSKASLGVPVALITD